MSRDDSVIPFDRLPKGFAQSLDEPPAVPAEPRPAATIVLMRDSNEGLEILLMRRNRNSGFVPGAYVFPGGRVDRSDGESASATLVDGLTPEQSAQRLALKDPFGAMAYYMAALREAFEETGILVGVLPDGSSPPTAADDEAVDAVRDRLMGDELRFSDVLTELNCRVAGDAIEYIAHWITPIPEPRRYDTRFFAARVPEGTAAIVDPREMTDAIWITPGGALRRCDEGTLPMVFPTIKTLEELEEYPTVDQALDGFGSAPVRTILPTLVITPTGVGLEIDGDP